MLSSFLFHVLRENQAIIVRHMELRESALDEGLKLQMQEKIEKYQSNAVFSICEFIKYSILTNTYQEARSWIDDNKGDFLDEFDLVADGLTRPLDKGVIWQADWTYFKWRLFVEAFKPAIDGN